MPIINLAGSPLGEVGKAAASQLANQHALMSQMMQLAQLQESRRATSRRLDLAEQTFAATERARAAERERSARVFSEGVRQFEVSRKDRIAQQAEDAKRFDRTQSAYEQRAAFQSEMALREEQRAIERQTAALEQAETDNEFRERAFADEQQSRLANQERLGRLADAQIASDKANTEARQAQVALGREGVARQVQQALPSRYPITATGVLDMRAELGSFDPRYTQQVDATLRRMLGDDVIAGATTEELLEQLETHPMMPALYSQIGETLMREEQRNLADRLEDSMKGQVAALGARIEALGDSEMLGAFEADLAMGVTEASSDDESFLDYGTGAYREQLGEWRSRVKLAETKKGLMEQIDRIRGERSMADIVTADSENPVGEAIEQIQAAETPEQARAAFGRVLPLLDPQARFAVELRTQQMVGAGFPDPGPVDSERVEMQFGVDRRLNELAPDEVDLMLQGLGEVGFGLDDLDTLDVNDPAVQAVWQKVVERRQSSAAAANATEFAARSTAYPNYEDPMEFDMAMRSIPGFPDDRQ